MKQPEAGVVKMHRASEHDGWDFCICLLRAALAWPTMQVVTDGSLLQ